jgi:hypothetical protein
MMRIVYVGFKEMKADNVAGTGLVWSRGEIHEVEEEAKVAKLLAHPLIWRDADQPYELMPVPVAVKPEPRVSIIPVDNQAPYWEPIVQTVPGDVFDRLQKKELVSVFMTAEDADAFADWKLKQEKALSDTAPKNTGPAVDKRTKEYKESLKGKAA